MFVWEMLMLA
jgi:hypothetical protein